MALASRIPKASAKSRGFQRWQALQRLGFEDYAAYLRSPEWAAVKRRYSASDRPQSCICGEIDGLQLHHLTYERVGREEMTDLRSLCRDCHAAAHVLERRGDLELDLEGLFDADRARSHQEAARERTAAIAEEQSRKRLDFSKLSLSRRLRLVSEVAARKRIDISSQFRVIERQIVRMERKLDSVNP